MRIMLVLCLSFCCVFGGSAVSSPRFQLSDAVMQHIIGTLPRMAPQLKEAGINVSQAYYIWPRDAALDARGQVLLEEYGYDAIRQDALETFCKAWFCLNYDQLLPRRQQILSTFEEQHFENPYIADDQKRINVRILNKDLGHSREELKSDIGERNLRQVRVYRDKIAEIWEKIEEE